MATVQSHPFDPSLEDLPAWKKDLILRKRANSKLHGGLPVRSGGKTTPLFPNGIPPQQMLLCSVQGAAQLSSRSVQGSHQDSSCLLKGPSYNYSQSSLASDRSCSVGSANDRCENKNSDGEVYSVIIANAMKAPTNMYQKGLVDCAPRGKGPWNGHEDDEGDLEYGPGIVSRLKNRYMTIAMREARGRSSLRRYCSLEDLLDDEEPAWLERGRTAQKPRPPQDGSANNRDYMKRARSMDSLALRRMDSRDKVPKSRSSGALRPANLNAMGNKDIIIIETTRPSSMQNGDKIALQSIGEHPRKTSSSSSLLEEEEMPAPDMVKQVKQIFESSGRSSRGTAAKVAAYKATQAKNKKQAVPAGIKPALKAKPPQLQAKPPQLQARKSLHSPIEDAKSNLKQVSVVGRSSPRSTLSVKVAPTPLKNNVASPPVTAGLTPVTASVTSPCVTSPCVNGITEDGIKGVSPSAVGNIRKGNLQDEFDFTVKLKSLKQEDPHPRPHSPVANLPPSPTLSHRVNIGPTLKSESDVAKENERVLQENKKNSEKSKPFMKEVCDVNKLTSPTRTPTNPPYFTSVSLQKSPPPKLVSPTSAGQQPSFPSTVMQPNIATSQSKTVPAVKATTFAEESKSVCNQRTSVRQTSSQKPVPSETSSSTATDCNETSSSLLEVIKAAEAKEVKFSDSSNGSPVVMPGLKPSKGKDSRWNQPDNNTSLVFNFSKRTDTPTPDYIENDGVDLSKRQHFDKNRETGYVIMPGYDGKNDSSTDDFDEDLIDAKVVGGLPPPCNICFEGEAVIINGRSNLQRQPRTKKLEISFDMDSTRTFEYPSENALLEGLMTDDYSTSSNVENSTLPSNGGLANYTPSNLQFNESFELGVSRRAHPPTPPREKPNPFDVNLEEEHLRPADETETVTWSEESAPDMLF